MNQANPAEKINVQEHLKTVFDFFSTKLNELNLKSSEVLKKVIDQNHPIGNDRDGYDSVHVNEHEYNSWIQSLSEINSSISTLQAAVNQVIKQVSSTATEPVSSIAQHIQEVNQGLDKKSHVPYMSSLETILYHKVSPKLLGIALGTIDQDNSTLSKYAENISSFSPFEVVNWPDGWYKAHSKENVELLLTLDKSEKLSSPLRILITFHYSKPISALSSINDLVSIVVSDADQWLTRDRFGQTHNQHLKTLLSLKLSELQALNEMRIQEDPNNPTNQLT